MSDLSPTREAARQLASLLPDPCTPGGEAWRFFHFQTNDFCTVERTVRLACGMRKDLHAPLFLSIDRFYELVSGADTRKKRVEEFDFHAAQASVPELLDGCQVFVWQTFSKMSPNQAQEPKYSALLFKFLQFCESERAECLQAAAEGRRPGTELLPLSRQVVFISYGPYFPLPELLRESLCTIQYGPLTPEDFGVLLPEYWQRNEERTRRTLGGGRLADAMLKKKEPPVFSPELLKWYADYMAGIPELNVRRLLTEMAYPGGNVDYTRRERLEPVIVDYKNKILRQHGRLEVLHSSGGEVRGLETVRRWLGAHKIRTPGLAPTGILLVGIPGTGKSATAKMAAKIMDLPLVRLDMSKILGGYVGDSEKGMREMLDDLRFAAPCVLWIDEVEKAMGGADARSDGSGVMQRLFGMLLTFMQENDRSVFSVTTANDISRLPPEFFRNGRFDQAFCLMMPEYGGCCEIMQEKLTQRMRGSGWLGPEETADADTARRLFHACIGTKEHPRFLTGADIEAHVKELFSSYHRERADRPPEQELVQRMREAAKTVRVQAPADSPAAMREIAARYLDMMQRGLLMAGSADTPFVRENLELDRVRYYRYREGDRALPNCLRPPENYQERLASASEAEWYDARFFQCLVEAMNEQIILDRDRTPEETRQAYWKLKSARLR
ncbi:MAG: AAA family ATPase [Oscillospiraceae bacterium]|nr:AAA family ATPase [Oscillospiraceae bacterium]